MTERTGRCLCGAVHFQLSGEPLFTRVCWCRDCQHLAANGTVNMLVKESALSVAGRLSDYANTADSGNAVIRQFCPACGTHLFARSPAWPQYRIVRVGNLDDPSSVQPAMHMWAASAPAWACLNPALPCAEGQALPAKKPVT